MRTQTRHGGSAFREERWDARDRPQYWYEYHATGFGEFPYDMLRHDACWPARGEDAGRIEAHGRHAVGGMGRYTVRLHSHRRPTPERWESFRWTITAEEPAAAEAPAA